MVVDMSGYNVAIPLFLGLVGSIVVMAYLQRNWTMVAYGHIGVGAYMICAAVACLVFVGQSVIQAAYIVLGIGVGNVAWGIHLKRRDKIAPVKKEGRL